MASLSGQWQWTVETPNAAGDGAAGAFAREAAGILNFTITREGNSSPAVFACRVTADPVLDSAATKRYYPFMKIRLFDAASGQEWMPFVGRIDTAQLVETETGGRAWDIRARDYISILADNFIDKGSWRSAGPGFHPNDHDNGEDWVANYVGDYDETGDLGEFRKYIIMDLAMNIVTNEDYGIEVSLNHAPNSKRVEVNLDRDRTTTILDAIRELARSDPYSSGGEVDAKDIADSGFPDGSGFGGEFQMDYRRTSDGGQVANYFRRGELSSQLRYSYGDLDPLDSGPIIEYHFDREGADIYSRSKTIGRGEGVYDKEAADGGGTGVQVPGMETTWDPENGLFKVRRDSPIRFDGTVGDRDQEDADEGEEEAIRARALRDGAYGVLFSGASALQNNRGGPIRGKVTIPGPPFNGNNFLRPGELITLSIPQEGVVDAEFIVIKWEYTFPEDKTVIDVARVQHTDFGEQLISGIRKQADAASAQNSFYDSAWQVVDGSGTVSLKHSLGVRAGTVKVEMAARSGKTTTDGKHIPVLNTETDVHAAAFDAAQGQNHGYAVIENTPYHVTLKLARWAAYSDGAGRWFKNNENDVLVRVRLYA